MKKEHYQILKQAFINYIEKHGTACIQDYKQYLLTEGKAKDIHKRLRWDVLYATKIKISSARNTPDLPLYDYLNDNHIDTALKQIMKELNI